MPRPREGGRGGPRGPYVDWPRSSRNGLQTPQYSVYRCRFAPSGKRQAPCVSVNAPEAHAGPHSRCRDRGWGSASPSCAGLAIPAICIAHLVAQPSRPMPRKKQSTKAATEPIRYCDLCARDVEIGPRGEDNWNSHTGGSEHVQAAKKASESKRARKITMFFRPMEPAVSAPHGSLPGPAPIDATSPQEAAAQEATNGFRTTVIDDLRVLLDASAPITTALGTDATGYFLSDPVFSLDDDEYESHWHFVDCYLNRILGYGLTTEELAVKITTGALQLTGICDWLETVLRWPGVTVDLLEGKIDRLKAALVLCSATLSLNNSTSMPIDSSPGSRLPAVQSEKHTEDQNSSHSAGAEHASSGTESPIRALSHRPSPPLALTIDPRPLSHAVVSRPHRPGHAACAGLPLDVPAGKSPY
ncbi:hypothetical protein C2E23DRAFT_904021, partial [Lenzites betulinus]